LQLLQVLQFQPAFKPSFAPAFAPENIFLALTRVQSEVTCNLLLCGPVYYMKPYAKFFVEEIKVLVDNHPVGDLKVS
jgi:hypothetical protein